MVWPTLESRTAKEQNKTGVSVCVCVCVCVVDVDECRVYDNGGCSQLCYNTEGSFSCGCHAGYRLDHDRRTCQS